MKTHEILFSRGGNENATTAPDPVAVWTGQVDLETTDMYCASSDMDMLVPCKKYEVHTVTLPDWLSPEEWIANTIGWKYTWGCGVDPEWPEAWQRGLKNMGSAAQRVACADLLRTKKFRNTFRASLCEQLKKWLEGDSDFASPFSARQWGCLINVYVEREASAIENGLYYSRGRLTGAPVPEPKKTKKSKKSEAIPEV